MNKNTDNVMKIRIVLQQDCILQKLAPAEDYLLNPEIEEYLLKQSSRAKIRNRFEMDVFATHEQAEVFSKALRNTFEQKIIDAENEKKRNGVLALLMLLAGSMFLTISLLFQSIVVHEIFLVASWVFLWGATELFFFERRGKQIRIVIFKNLRMPK